MNAEILVAVSSYPLRRHADDLVEELQEAGIGATVVSPDRLVGTWDVSVPAGDGIRARMVVEGFPGY
jgi:hypothetical protein